MKFRAGLMAAAVLLGLFVVSCAGPALIGPPGGVIVPAPPHSAWNMRDILIIAPSRKPIEGQYISIITDNIISGYQHQQHQQHQ